MFGKALKLEENIMEKGTRRVFEAIYQSIIGVDTYTYFLTNKQLMEIITSMQSLIFEVSQITKRIAPTTATQEESVKGGTSFTAWLFYVHLCCLSH